MHWIIEDTFVSIHMWVETGMDYPSLFFLHKYPVQSTFTKTIKQLAHNVSSSCSQALFHPALSNPE